MLAAFPPPAQATTRTSRVGSWFRNSSSWPLAGPGNGGSTAAGADNTGIMGMATAARSPGSPASGASSGASVKTGRRCCGLPLWGFIVVVLIIVGVIAAAVLVPLEFFVFRNRSGNGSLAEQALQDCQASLPCSNGGTNVVSRGVCSCICTNGFTGSNCTVAGATGCTTTNLVTMDDSPGIDDVTLGQAIPRIIAAAQANFSMPLSGTAILARFNNASLSCIAQNSLVTFEGRSMRTGSADAVVSAEDGFEDDAAVRAAFFVSVSVITVGIIPLTTAQPAAAFQTIVPAFRTTTITGPSGTFVTSIQTGTLPLTTTTTVTQTLPPTPTVVVNPTADFTVTEEVLDFARVAVLFILQEDGLSDASQAQSVLQRFFTNAGPSAARGQAASTNQGAMNLNLGNGNTINLVNFNVNIGNGTVGGRPSRRSLRLRHLHARGHKYHQRGPSPPAKRGRLQAIP
jgi:hypothetical protein